MSRAALTLGILIGLAGAAQAQDGGKLPWRGKEKEPGDTPQNAMAEAKKSGRAMLLFFTSVG